MKTCNLVCLDHRVSSPTGEPVWSVENMISCPGADGVTQKSPSSPWPTFTDKRVSFSLLLSTIVNKWATGRLSSAVCAGWCPQNHNLDWREEELPKKKPQEGSQKTERQTDRQTDSTCTDKCCQYRMTTVDTFTIDNIMNTLVLVQLQC